jgi:type I restriction enzyme R subunit
MSAFTESVVEEAALAWLAGLGWTVLHGPGIAPDAAGGRQEAERAKQGSPQRQHSKPSSA